MRNVIFVDQYTLPILGAVVVCTLPHFPYVSIWVVIVCLLLWVYTAMAAVYSWRLPGRMVMRLTAGVFFVAAMTTHEGFTIEAFVALLALMVGMKLLEVRSQRDRMITVILCYFLIVGGLFFGDSIGVTLYKLFSILVTTAILIHLNQPRRGALVPLKLSLLLMAEAVPLALIMFLLFPRFQGGIWGRGHLNLARTGFSDEISFGDVAELARNTEVAFRVEFDGNIPQQNMLYWRGVVLWAFDGKTWRRGIGRRSNPSGYSEAFQRVNYTIMLEPHNGHWLLTLDLPTQIELRRAWLLNDYTCYRWRPITSRVSYRGISYLDANASLQEQFKKHALRLPDSGNPRARALAAAWFQEAETIPAYIQRVLDYFREQPFSYTLKPPPLQTEGDEENMAQDANQVDSFLFETRKGFCEHYAGSFAFMMRAAGVPARVVVGYQGGERNHYGGYLVVRQSDAHAWCEVWLAEKGWVRVDPTGVVAPDRLMVNVANALPPGETVGFLSLSRYGAFGQWLGNAASILDFMNNRWNRWVMGYSASEQEGIFSSLGIQIEGKKGWAGGLLIVLVLTAAGIVMISFVMLFHPKPARDEVADSWNDFCQKLSRIGLPRRPDQGPIDYMKHVLEQRPDLARHIREIVSSYVRIRYGGKVSANAILSLRIMIKRFSPKKHDATL